MVHTKFKVTVLRVAFPRPEAPVSPRNLLEMKIIGPHPTPLNQKLWGVQKSAFYKPSRLHSGPLIFEDDSNGIGGSDMESRNL